MRLKYANIKVEEYWNGYRPFYIHENGKKELLHVAVPTKEMALAYGKAEVDFMNGKE